ncbi:MAG: ABC transporter transmembrane domain-containing protein [Pseudomonadota bacterium]
MNAETESARRGNAFRPLIRLLPYARKYPGLLIGALIFLLIGAVTTLALPMAVRRMVDFGFAANDAALINQYFSFLIILSALLAISSALRFFFVLIIGERIVADLRRDVFSKVMELSADFFDSARSGEIVSRLSADTTQIKAVLGATASQALRNIILAVGALIMMVITSPWLSAIVIGAIPLIIVPLIAIGRIVRQRSRMSQDALAEASAYSSEAIGAVRVFQDFANERAAQDSYSGTVQAAYAAAKKAISARALLTAMIIFMVAASVVAVLWIGATNVLDGSMSGGMLGQFVLYAALAASALAVLSEVSGDMQLAAGAAARLSDLADEIPTVADPDNPRAADLNYDPIIEFKNVSFSYPTRPDIELLNGLNLQIKHGETLAIVGPSGAGKSTIFSLLMRHYDALEGNIEVGGVAVQHQGVHALRTNIAMVPQEPTVLSGTIFENIAFADANATREQVHRAAEVAQLSRFVEGLSARFETPVGERGITLSGGQKQRIAIARAVLRDAPILLLDEATSALDAENEMLIQKAVSNVIKDKTTIIIAHRLATVRKADRIVVMDQGKIIEEGTHDSLARKKNGVYAKLAALQFSDSPFANAAE